ncbi:MAG: hypothetical protein KC656_03770, partial [Myxococcales bacterium]|nr:hypothetical protein [Myxococcales bacterium]
MADAFRVPAELEPLFQRAQAYVREYFGELSADPAEGAVRFHGERYIRVRAASISIGFFDIVRTVYRGHRDPDEVAAALLYDVAHALGASDARRFADAMGVSEPLEVLSAGPVHFAFAGWALVDLHPDSRPVPDSSFLLAYDHPNSFEAEAWMDAGRKATRPVCVMNAGYSSGWCEAAFGLPLVAREVECRARGHAACRFVMATPERIDERVRERHGPLAPSALPGIFELVRRHEEELARAHRMETVGRFAGAVAHDFNNLLTVMSGHAQQLADALPSGSEGARSAAAILDAADRATALTARLLSLADPSSIEPVPIDLADLVRDLTPVLNGLVGDTIALLTRVPKEAWALGSPAVERVVIELVMSAREALRDGGQMSVRVLREADRWAVQVEDDGNSSSREP